MSWIGQKTETETSRAPEAPATPTSTTSTFARTESRASSVANIGKSLKIKGELSGNEDLTIEGNIEGQINLKDHNLTIGQNGKIVAEIRAKSVNVAGQVKGNIVAVDKIEVASTGVMLGDLTAPRVILADGCRFKGSIDMEGGSGGSAVTTATKAAAAKPELAGTTK